MKLKLDENLGNRCAEMLRLAGHHVTTVREQNLCSSTDQDLLKTCLAEQRCLVTLDLEFGNPLRFKPTEYEGIAVLRLPHKPTLNDLYDAITTLIGGLSQKEIAKRLWIVQRGKIREYQSEG
jgi:hypothetical protein